MIIDAFAVAGGYPARPIKIGPPELRAAMGKNGVDRALTMSMRAIQVDAVTGNDYLIALAASDPRILPVAVLDPRAVTQLDLIIERAVAGKHLCLEAPVLIDQGPVALPLVQELGIVDLRPEELNIEKQGKCNRIENIGVAHPKAYIDHGNYQHQNQPGRKHRHLLRCPGRQVAIGGRIEHHETNRRNHRNQ